MKLPPLNPLRAFEAAGRLQSFSQASEELNVTQGAISKQIKTLEDALGVRLFERKQRHIVLSAEGQRLMEPIQNALRIIEMAVDGIESPQSRKEVITLNLLPSLSTRWILPIVSSFKEKYPQYTVNIEIGQKVLDFESSPIDMAVRVAKENQWKKMSTQPLMKEELVAVYSPALGNISAPEDLGKFTLLEHTSRPGMWEEYLQSLPFKGIPRVTFGHGFEHFFILAQAALNGAGLALIPKFLIEEELTTSRLQIAFGHTFKSGYTYYLITPKHKEQLVRVKRFRGWIGRW